MSSRCPLILDNMEIPVLSRITFDHYNNHSKLVECRSIRLQTNIIGHKARYLIHFSNYLHCRSQLQFAFLRNHIHYVSLNYKHGIPTLFDRPSSLVPAVR